MSLSSSGQSLWFLSRGSGTVILVLLTVTVVLGVLTRGGRPLPGLPRFAIGGLHRNASLLAVLFLVVHVLTAVLDSYVQLRLVDIVVPFGAAYHPVLVGLGALALDVLLVLVLTSLVRDRLGVRLWRAIHWTGYACWPVAMLHGVLLGPDSLKGLLLWVTVGCVAAFAVAVGWRLLGVRRDVAAGAARRARTRQA